METPDSSGSSLAATLIATTLVPGRFGTALQVTAGLPGNHIAGLSEAAVRGPQPVLQPQQVTALAWVKQSGSPGDYRYVLADGAQACNASSYALETGSNGGLVFYVNDGTAVHVSPDAGPRIWDGNWHMVAGAFDGSTVRLYVDGLEVGTGAPAATSIAYGAATASSDFVMGEYPGAAACSGNFQWTGEIDEARVYSTALSPDDISYLAGASASTPPELPVPSATTTTTTAPTTTTSTSVPTTTSPTPTTSTTPTTTAPGHIVPVLKTVATSAGRQAVFDSAGTTAHGSAIARYDYTVSAGGREYQLSCSANAPMATVNFSGAAGGTVKLTAVTASGRTASTAPVPFKAPAQRPSAVRNILGGPGGAGHR